MRGEYGGKTPIPEREGNKEGRTEREGNKEGRTWASLLFAFSHHKDTLCVNKLSMVFVFFSLRFTVGRVWPCGPFWNCFGPLAYFIAFLDFSFSCSKFS